MTILIRENQVERLLLMPQAITLVEEALGMLGRGEAENRPRQRVRGQVGLLNLMLGGLSAKGYMGFKAYTAFRGRTRFYFHLFDARTGEYLAIVEADRLGQIRTGAASGVATRHLARSDASVAGIYGTGWQAESQLLAVCAVRPIRLVRAYSRDRGRREEFSRGMSARLGISVEPAEQPEQVAKGSDVLITITTSAAPVLLGRWLEPGVHINAAGGNRPQHRELDDEAVARSTSIFVDYLDQAMIESGDLIGAEAAGRLDRSRVRELGSVVAGSIPGRTSEEDITLLESQGIAVEDVAVGSYVYERARAEGIGEELPL